METTKRRQKKRYGWLVFFALLNWLTIAYVIWRVDPESMKDIIVPGAYLPMAILTAGGIFWLLSILFLSSVTALRWTVGMTMFLELRVLGLGTPINGLLILGLLVSWEIYLLKTRTQGIKELKTQDNEVG